MTSTDQESDAMETYATIQQWNHDEPWGTHDLTWCRTARAKRAECTKYFGTLSPETTNSAQSVKALYR